MRPTVLVVPYVAVKFARQSRREQEHVVVAAFPRPKTGAEEFALYLERRVASLVQIHLIMPGPQEFVGRHAEHERSPNRRSALTIMPVPQPMSSTRSGLFLQTTLREPVEMRDPVPASSGTVRIGAGSLGWRLAWVAGDGWPLGPPAASGGGSAEAGDKALRA